MQRDYRRRYRIDALRSLRSFDDGVSDDSLKVQSVFVQKKSAGRFDGNVEGIRERERAFSLESMEVNRLYQSRIWTFSGTTFEMAFNYYETIYEFRLSQALKPSG